MQKEETVTIVDYVEIVPDNEGEADPTACAIDNLVWDLIAAAAEQEHKRLMREDPAYRRFHAQNVLAFALSVRR